MNRKLKRAVSFHLVSGLVIVTPFLVSILIAIIGATYWIKEEAKPPKEGAWKL